MFRSLEVAKRLKQKEETSFFESMGRRDPDEKEEEGEDPVLKY